MKSVNMFTFPIKNDREKSRQKKVEKIVSCLESNNYVFVKLVGLEDLVKRGRLDLYHELLQEYDWLDIKSDPATFANSNNYKPNISGVGNVDYLPESCLRLQVQTDIVHLFRAAMKVSEQEELVAKMDIPQVVLPGQGQSYIGYKETESDICGLLTLTDQLMTKERMYVPASTLLLFKRDKMSVNFFYSNPARGAFPWLGLRLGFFKKSNDPLKDIRADLFYQGRFGVHVEKREGADEKLIKKKMTKFARHNKDIMHMYADLKPSDHITRQFPHHDQFQINEDKRKTKKRTHTKQDGDILEDIKKKRSESVQIITDQDPSVKRILHIPKLKVSERPFLKRGLSDRVQSLIEQDVVKKKKMDDDMKKEINTNTESASVIDDTKCHSVMDVTESRSVMEASDRIKDKQKTLDHMLQKKVVEEEDIECPGSPFPEWNSDTSQLKLMEMPNSFKKKMIQPSSHSSPKRPYKLEIIESVYKPKWIPEAPFNEKDPRFTGRVKVNKKICSKPVSTESLSDLLAKSCVSVHKETEEIGDKHCTSQIDDAEKDAKSIVDMLYKEDTRIEQKKVDHSLQNKLFKPKRKYIEPVPSTLTESTGVYHCNTDQVIIYHRRGLSQTEKGLTDSVIVCNNDKQGRVSHCFVQSKSLSHLTEEVRGALTVLEVLKAYAISYNEHFGKSKKKHNTVLCGRNYKKDKSIFRIETEENEDERQLLNSIPETGRVYTIIKMPKCSTDSEHVWFDPSTENDDTDKLNNTIECIVDYSKNAKSKVRGKLLSLMPDVNEKEIETVLENDLDILYSLCESVEKEFTKTDLYEGKDLDKMMGTIQYRLNEIYASLAEHISHPSVNVSFPEETLIGLMRLFASLGNSSLFGLQYFFDMMKREGLSYTDLICKIALPNMKQFIGDICNLIRSSKEMK